MNEKLTIPQVLARLNELGCTLEPCGSRVTCVPPPTDTDVGYLVVVPERLKGSKSDPIAEVVGFLWDADFKWEGGEHYQKVAADDFMSWRRDETNLIVTANDNFARRHRCATALCKRLNLPKKPDRIALFQAVLYGNVWDENTTNKPKPAPQPDIWEAF